MRHCLDYVRAVLSGLSTGIVEYDRRSRATEIETDRNAAKKVIETACKELLKLHDPVCDQSVQVEVLLTSGTHYVKVASTIGRELAFTGLHAIHHHAPDRPAKSHRLAVSRR
ncbi:hypothetical protein ACFLU6_15995 [Acidobacteriota bacterium]